MAESNSTKGSNSADGNGAARGRAEASTSGQPRRPAERYGSSTAGRGLFTGRILAVVLGVLGVALIIAIGAYLYTQFTGEKISGEVVNSQVLDDSTLELTVDVTSNRTDRPAYCIVRAKDVASAEVGRAEIVVPAGREHTRVTTKLATTNRASIGDVYGCDFDFPAYLKVPEPAQG